MPSIIPSLPTLSTRSPLLTTLFSAIAINILANILAQLIEYQKIQRTLDAHDALETLALDIHARKPFQVDKLRVLQFVIWTVLSVPLNFKWQVALERRLPGFLEGREAGKEKEKGGLPVVEVGVGGEIPIRPKKRNFKNTLLKILCDQTIAAPINCTMFLVVMTLLKGGGIYDAVQTVRKKFWPLKFAGWRLWPLVGLLNFTFVPVDKRVIVSTVVGLCWNVFLALFIS